MENKIRKGSVEFNGARGKQYVIESQKAFEMRVEKEIKMLREKIENSRKKRERKKRFKKVLAIFCCVMILVTFSLNAVMALGGAIKDHSDGKEMGVVTTKRWELLKIPESEQLTDPLLLHKEQKEADAVEDAEEEKLHENPEKVVDAEASITKKAELSAFGPSDTYFYEITAEDKLLIAKVVYAEARGESLEGQVAVASVILNRFFHGGPNGAHFKRESIESVVTQRAAFASSNWVTKAMLDKYPNCEKAVELACRGWDPTREKLVEGAYFFYNPKGIGEYATKERAKLKEDEKFQIGNHIFHTYL